MRISTLIIMMISAAAAIAADDPGGWSKAKWGMNEAQLLSILQMEGAARLDPPEPNLHARVHIPSFDLAGAQFHVYFVPDKDGLLSSVLLSPVKPPAAGLDFLFQNLQNLAVEKYGRPWRSSEGSIDEIQWSLKTTTITLRRTKLTGFGTQFVTLQYKQKDPDLDKM